MRRIRYRGKGGQEQTLLTSLLDPQKHPAKEANVSPLRISFIASYRFIRDEFLWCAVAQAGAIPAHLKRLRQQLSLFLLPKRRSSRRYPRAVKRKASQYPSKRKGKPPRDS